MVVGRSHGVDVATGDGLDRALGRTFFTTGTGNLFAAEQQAKVKHHVLLSIVGLGRLEGNADLAGPEPQDLVDMARRTLAARASRSA